jgi:hypothetical protein
MVFSEMPSPRINPKYPSVPMVSNVVGDHDHPLIYDNNLVKVMEDIEPRKKETGAPERAWNPGIHVIVIPGRRIVGDDWRALIIIIIINYRGLGAPGVISCVHVSGILILRIGHDRDPGLCSNVLK